jgi:hypothetical protein
MEYAPAAGTRPRARVSEYPLAPMPRRQQSRRKQIRAIQRLRERREPRRLAEPGALSTGTAWLRDAARPNLISQVASPKPQRRSRNWNTMAPTKSGRSHPAKMARPWNASAPSGNAHHAQHFNREAIAAQAVQTAMNSGRSLYIERSRSARIGQHRNVKWGSVLRRWSGRVAACEEIIG